MRANDGPTFPAVPSPTKTNFNWCSVVASSSESDISFRKPELFVFVYLPSTSRHVSKDRDCGYFATKWDRGRKEILKIKS